MKYIRTKDAVYEVIETYINNAIPYENQIEHRTKPRYEKIWNKLIIKQADTIEELCDEFVWISVDSVNNEYHNRKANEYGLRTNKMQVNSPQIKSIYGAIWTDKGLIYVAKMGKNGELELIWK